MKKRYHFKVIDDSNMVLAEETWVSYSVNIDEVELSILKWVHRTYSHSHSFVMVDDVNEKPRKVLEDKLW